VESISLRAEYLGTRRTSKKCPRTDFSLEIEEKENTKTVKTKQQTEKLERRLLQGTKLYRQKTQNLKTKIIY
jgi:hypothetical protein